MRGLPPEPGKSQRPYARGRGVRQSGGHWTLRSLASLRMTTIWSFSQFVNLCAERASDVFRQRLKTARATAAGGVPGREERKGAEGRRKCRSLTAEAVRDDRVVMLGERAPRATAAGGVPDGECRSLTAEAVRDDSAVDEGARVKLTEEGRAINSLGECFGSGGRNLWGRISSLARLAGCNWGRRLRGPGRRLPGLDNSRRRGRRDAIASPARNLAPTCG